MSDYDVIIIGAGAAGLMAGIAAGEAGARVLLLDGARKIGAKILVAGGGRCNVTNEKVTPQQFHGEGAPKFVERVLRAFSVADTHRFFNKHGVPLKLEPEMGKCFPVSDSGRTVLNALVQGACAANCELLPAHRVIAIERDGGHWTVRADADNGPRQFRGATVILCSGGKALPKSGSDGAGYGFALQYGHTLIQTTPALSPLLCDKPLHAPLSGITLPVRLSLHAAIAPGAPRLPAYTGSFLFTHQGYSGPAALNLSRHVARERWKHPEALVSLRLLPDVPDGGENAWWHEYVRTNAKKSLHNALSATLPARVAETLYRSAGVAPELSVGKVPNEAARRLRDALFALPLPVTRVADYVKAEATAGGIALSEIEPATMMSRLAPGLFLSGEVCDVDGELGGFNFQWAWSSGVVAGRSAARYSRKVAGSGL